MKSKEEVLREMARRGQIGPKAQKGKEAERVRRATAKYRTLDELAEAYVDSLTGHGPRRGD